MSLLKVAIMNSYFFDNTKKQRLLSKTSSEELQSYYAQGLFSAGSMGPKVHAAIRFLENGGEKAIIADINKAWSALQGKTGTLIMKE